MTYPLLRDKLTSLHPDRPQAQRTIELALAEVHSALTRLSSLGHHFHLEEGTAEQVREWPRVLYHLESSPCGRVVNSHWDYEELGPVRVSRGGKVPCRTGGAVRWERWGESSKLAYDYLALRRRLSSVAKRPFSWPKNSCRASTRAHVRVARRGAGYKWCLPASRWQER